MKLTKEQFIHCIETYKKMREEETELFNALHLYDECIFDEWLNNYYDLLSEMCEFDIPYNDIGWVSDLDYFVFELDFGRLYRDGCIEDADGNPIKMSTAEELWDILTKGGSNDNVA